MAIENSKLVNLQDVKVLYDDLRSRVEAVNESIGTVPTGETVEGQIAELEIGKAPVIEETVAEAPVVSVSDAAANLPVKLTVGIDPVQDLHGYDYPWVGGAGKNKWSLGAFASWNNKPFSLPAGTYTVSVDASTLVGMRFFYGEGTENSVVASLKESNNYTDTITLPSDCIKINTSVSEGGTVENVQIEAGETKTTYEPYANICPISGWTGCKVTRTGKNFVDVSLADWKSGYLINASGNEQSNSSYKYTQYYYRVKGAGTVTFSYTSDGQRDSYFTLIEYDANKNFIGRKTTGATVAEGYNKATVTLDEGTAFVRFNAPKTATITNLMLEYAPDATEYEPFGTTYNISFPDGAGTVYGGELTINKDGSGTLAVDRAVLDISKRTWTYNSKGYFITSGSDIKRASSSSAVPDLLLSDRYKADTPTRAVSSDANLQRNGIMSIGVSNSTVIIRNYAYTDPTLFAASGGTVVYPLATAGPYPLTPGQVKSLLGYNALWADTGNIKSVDYCADTKSYIDALFSSILPATGVSF